MLLISIGGVIGSLTKAEIITWYSVLNRSNLTPQNYVFLVAWTILYGIIGACGWLIWRTISFQRLNLIRGSSHLKLELDTIVFLLSLNWTFSYSFERYGYHDRRDNLASLPKNENSIAAADALFILDSICDLLKLLHMVV